MTPAKLLHVAWKPEVLSSMSRDSTASDSLRTLCINVRVSQHAGAAHASGAGQPRKQGCALWQTHARWGVSLACHRRVCISTSPGAVRASERSFSRFVGALNTYFGSSYFAPARVRCTAPVRGHWSMYWAVAHNASNKPRHRR